MPLKHLVRHILVLTIFDICDQLLNRRTATWNLFVIYEDDGFALLLGKMLNIKDVYSHPLFYKGLDEKTGFRTR